jgi:hypothetical protein
MGGTGVLVRVAVGAAVSVGTGVSAGVFIDGGVEVGGAAAVGVPVGISVGGGEGVSVGAAVGVGVPATMIVSWSSTSPSAESPVQWRPGIELNRQRENVRPGAAAAGTRRMTVFDPAESSPSLTACSPASFQSPSAL